MFTGPKDYCSQFFADSVKYVSTAIVDSSNGIKSFFYSNNDDNFFLHRWNFRLNTICRSLRNGDLFTGPKDCCSQFFCGFRKVRFHCYSPQFKWNQVVLLLKQWRRLLLTSLRLSFKYHLYMPQKWGFIYLSKRLLFTIFYGFRKVRFHCYSPQFKGNQVVLLLKQWRRLLLTSLRLSFKYHLYMPQKWGFIYWSKRLLFTIFCGFHKVRFHCYSPRFKWNHSGLVLKQWRWLLLTSLKLSFKYHL